MPPTTRCATAMRRSKPAIPDLVRSRQPFERQGGCGPQQPALRRVRHKVPMLSLSGMPSAKRMWRISFERVTAFLESRRAHPRWRWSRNPRSTASRSAAFTTTAGRLRLAGRDTRRRQRGRGHHGKPVRTIEEVPETLTQERLRRTCSSCAARSTSRRRRLSEAFNKRSSRKLGRESFSPTPETPRPAPCDSWTPKDHGRTSACGSSPMPQARDLAEPGRRKSRERESGTEDFLARLRGLRITEPTVLSPTL